MIRAQYLRLQTLALDELVLRALWRVFRYRQRHILFDLPHAIDNLIVVPRTSDVECFWAFALIANELAILQRCGEGERSH